MKDQEVIKMDDINQQTGVLLYVSKLLYPKYNPFWFIFYMYLAYYRIYKRTFTYVLKAIPKNFISNLKCKDDCFNDFNNTAIVHTLSLYKTDKLLKLYSKQKKKIYNVYVFSSSQCKRNEIFVPETLYYNINLSEFDAPFQLVCSNENSIQFADEIEVSLINSPLDLTNSIIDGLLERYFKTPKLVKKDDILEIDIKTFSGDMLFLNNKVNYMETIHFKCNKVVFKNCEVYDGYYCAIGETAIKQSVNRQSFVPPVRTRTTNVAERGEEDIFEEIPLCPDGLHNYLTTIEKSVCPFIKKRQLKLKPLFLLQGDAGSGKSIILSSLASQLGMHLYSVNNSDLLANVYVQAETKLRNIFFTAKMAAPCILSINNFENFGKNNDGQYDERIMGNFADELQNLFENNPFPVILFCCSDEKSIAPDLKKLFLETFQISAPNDLEREQILRWIIKERGIKTTADLPNVANKTHGFLYEDLKSLVYYAEFDIRRRNSTKMATLADENFSNAIDYMQANYNESIGAPKVPKVQWSDVGGLGDVKEEIIKTINLPLKHPELILKSGLRRSGILLFGPPGTGKTLIAKAVATECNLCFLSVKGPELLNMYVGQSEQNVREVFEKARQASPCIIFFDELDALAPNRGLSGDSGGVMDRVVSQLLAEMDGLNDSATLFIIGATNRPDLIDQALLRPGRFDKLLYVGPCTDEESKISVLKALTRDFKMDETVDIEEIAKACPTNITGADFYGICSNAWSSAVRRLIINIESGKLEAQNITHQDVLVTFDDLKIAIDSVKPSISRSDMLYFEKLKLELGANTMLNK